MKIAIDCGNLFILDVDFDKDSQELSIEYSEDLEPLAASIYVNIGAGAQEYKLKDLQSSKIKLVDVHQPIEIKIGAKSGDGQVENGRTVVAFKVDPVTVVSDRDSLLTIYEIRKLIMSKLRELPKIFNKKPDIKLITDLHTHLTSCPRGSEFINIATQHGNRPYYYPVGLLSQLGIDMNDTAYSDIKVMRMRGVENATNKSGPYECIDLRLLRPEDKKKFAIAHDLSVTQQSVFNNLDERYVIRDYLVKDIDLLEDMLWSVAHDFANQGIQVVSISNSKIADRDVLEITDRVVAEIEKELGLKIRFLAAMNRRWHEDQMTERFDTIMAAAEHPCIEGVDFLASETNSTWEFISTLQRIASWAAANNPDFIIRVHAGENSYHPDNVRLVLAIASYYGIRVRIGHGLYGIDKETLDLAKDLAERGLIIVEMNPDSNFALNNLDSSQHLSLIQFAKAGVPCVLGTDGPGLYSTTAEQVARHLRFLQTSPEEYAQILDVLRKGESMYLMQDTERYKATQQRLKEKYKGLTPSKAFDMMYANIKKTVTSRWPRLITLINARIIRRNKLNKYLAKNLIVTDPEIISQQLAGKIPILITGAILDNNAASIAEFCSLITTLLQNLDPAKVYFVTSGNDYGVQKIVHELVHAHNVSNREQKFALVGHIPRQAKAEAISPLLTHATMDYEQWYDMYGKMVQEQINNQQQSIIVGGGMLTRDLITALYNATLDSGQCSQLLLVDEAGASRDKAQLFGTDSLLRYEDILRLFYALSLFKPNVSIEEILKTYGTTMLHYVESTAPSKQGRYDAQDWSDKERWCKTLYTLHVNPEASESEMQDTIKSFLECVRTNDTEGLLSNVFAKTLATANEQVFHLFLKMLGMQSEAIQKLAALESEQKGKDKFKRSSSQRSLRG